MTRSSPTDLNTALLLNSSEKSVCASSLSKASFDKCTYRICCDFQKRNEENNLRVFILPYLQHEPIRKRGRRGAIQYPTTVPRSSRQSVTGFGNKFGAKWLDRSFILNSLCTCAPCLWHSVCSPHHFYEPTVHDRDEARRTNYESVTSAYV